MYMCAGNVTRTHDSLTEKHTGRQIVSTDRQTYTDRQTNKLTYIVRQMNGQQIDRQTQIDRLLSIHIDTNTYIHIYLQSGSRQTDTDWLTYRQTDWWKDGQTDC